MQVEEYIDLNPKLLKIIMETLDYVKEERRMDFIVHFYNRYDQAVKNARADAESNKVDYKTALRQEIDKMDLDLPRFCIHGC